MENESREQWLRGGERVPVTLKNGETHEIFVRSMGSGPTVTMLHGYPGSSWEWHKVAPELSRRRRVLCFDFLGFGESDKPNNHRYSVFEQAEICEAVWAHFGVEQTSILAYNYGAIVVQALLERHQRGALAVELHSCVLSNCSLVSELYRPRLIQRLLAAPVVGDLLSRLVNERRFAQSWSAVFGVSPPSQEEIHEHWCGVSARGGLRVQGRLLRYMAERREHAAVLETALAETSVPLTFVWGLRDPVSGAPVFEALREQFPSAEFIGLDDAGHCPHLERPTDIVAATLAA